MRSLDGIAGAIGRRVRIATWALRRVAPAPAASGDPVVAQVLSWIPSYLARPHPALGRPGAVCPYAQAALAQDRVRVVVEGGAGARASGLLEALLTHGRPLLGSPRDPVEPALDAVLVVFPDLPPQRFGLLDQVHSEVKTQLMRRGIMVSALHPHSTRPALRNPDFHVLRAPFPAFAMRPMDVRDIVFLDHNPAAFDAYDRRFGRLHAEGRVSDQFGYASAYARARVRHGNGGWAAVSRRLRRLRQPSPASRQA